MKKLFTYFFCTLGVLTFIVLCGLAYLWLVDPFGVRPIERTLLNPTSASTTAMDTETTTQSEDKNPLLSPAQETAFETIGIDPTQLPTTITPAMQKCFTDRLGSVRVREIQDGDTSTAYEIFLTRSCYQ